MLLRKGIHFKTYVTKLILLFFLLFATVAISQTNIKGANAITSDQSHYTGTKAVVVGISNYMNIRSLNYAHSDALNFYNFLISDAGGRVDSNNIVLLLNNNATSANIYASLDWLVEEAKEGERIIIYFSGHGDLETKTIRQNGFLLGYDAPEHCYMAGGTVSVGFLQDYLETIAQQCKSNILLITDACRSGKLAGGEAGAKNTSAALAQNWQSITKVLSSQAGEYSLEADSWGNGAGVFTHFLVNGLTGKADKNNNKKVSTQELYMYLMENIGRETNYVQNPILVGDMTSTLAWVDSLSLAQLDLNNQIGSHNLLATKGFESLYKEQLSIEAYAKYEKFRYCLKNELLIPEYSDDENAWDIYQRLIEDEKAEIIHKHIRRSILAALQNRSQIAINLYLESESIEDSVSIIKAGKELNYAYKIINPDYILYNDIKARYLFFQSIKTNLTEDERIAFLKAAIEINPDAAYLYNQLGAKYRDIEKFDIAITTYKKAIEFAPTWIYVYNNLGVTYYELKQYSNAIESYRKAIELKPDGSSAYNNLGLTYYDQKQYNNAIESYQKAIELNPDDATVYNNLGVTYYNLKQYNKAIESYQKAIEIEPDYSSVYNNLGNVYCDINQYNMAIESYQKAIELKPDDASAYINLGITFFNINQYNKAIESYHKAIELKPNDVSVYNDLGIIYENLKKYNKAIEFYQKAIELNPNFILSYQNLTIVYRRYLFNYKKALEYTNKVIELEPDNCKNYETLANIYLDMDDFDKALKSFNLALELAPDDHWNYYNITCFYARQNKIDIALEWMEKSLKKGFNDWDYLASDYVIYNIIDTEKYKELMRKYKKDN